MLSKKEVILESVDCALMLGMTLEEYQDSLKEIKNPAFGSDIKKVSEDDNNFFEYLGVKEGDLKKKR